MANKRIYEGHVLVKKVLKMSLHLKKKAGWARDVGCGFLKEEIDDILYGEVMQLDYLRYRERKAKERVLTVHLTENRVLQYPPDSFNLRETEEMLSWAIDKVKEEKIEKIRGD